jgi:hypothetical protein
MSKCKYKAKKGSSKQACHGLKAAGQKWQVSFAGFLCRYDRASSSRNQMAAADCFSYVSSPNAKHHAMQ